MKKLIYLISGVLALSACHTSKKAIENNNDNMGEQIEEAVKAPNNRIIVGTASPAVFIYKMKADYSNLVPVIMNAEKTKIVSYPAPVDVYYKGVLAKPSQLVDGYWLDNRGINENVAFTSYTYEEYSALETAPSMSDLMNHIVEKNPLTEWRQCGVRADYDDIVTELNDKIKKGAL